MRIGVYADALTRETGYGIRNYTVALLHTLNDLDQELEFYLFARKPLVEIKLPKNFRFFQTFNLEGWWYYLLPFYVWKHKIDVLLMPRESVPFFLGRKTIPFVFDLMHLYFNEHLSFKARLDYFLAEKFDLPRALRVVAISESTRNDILNRTKVIPDRITIVNPPVDPEVFYPRPISEIENVRKIYELRRPYFLNASSVLWHRKNLLNLVSAFGGFNELNPGHDLVIIGRPGPIYAKMQEHIETLGITENIRLLDKVPEADVPILMSGCSVFVFPSFHEGFGMPVVEAMSCGVPVITSNTSAMPEAGGDAAILVDPHSETEITEAMTRAVEDENLRRSMVQRGHIHAKRFVPEISAQRLLDLIHEVFSESQPPRIPVERAL